MNAKERKNLAAAMRRVGNEITLHEKMTGTDQFFESVSNEELSLMVKNAELAAPSAGDSDESCDGSFTVVTGRRVPPVSSEPFIEDLKLILFETSNLLKRLKR